jgi:hypothetical protein
MVNGQAEGLTDRSAVKLHSYRLKASNHSPLFMRLLGKKSWDEADA